MRRPSHKSARGNHAPFCFVAAFLAALFITPPGAAQRPCGQRDTVLELLAEKYRETPVAAGVTAAGGLIEVLVSREGGTWTIVVTSPRGLSCFMASGEGWRSFGKPAPDGPDA